MEKVNIACAMAGIREFWQPRIAGELNGQHIKLAKLKGEFVMHHHECEDEMFLVTKGTLILEFADRTESLNAGEFLIIPRGVPHKPVAENEVEVMLFEPASTRNTGNVENELTISTLERLTAKE
ncbi:MAG: cupin domain-containing protein [Desulfoprunum sp.]|nr:cupin domain-containing protein [Desulfoprunum sp.]